MAVRLSSRIIARRRVRASSNSIANIQLPKFAGWQRVAHQAAVLAGGRRLAQREFRIIIVDPTCSSNHNRSRSHLEQFTQAFDPAIERVVGSKSSYFKRPVLSEAI